MANRPQILTREVQVSNPFEVVELPFVVTLLRIGYHRFRRRWTKRLFKKPARLLFEFGYHALKIGGRGKFRFHRRGEAVELEFNGRNAQFGGIYDFPRDHVFECPIAALQAIILPPNGVFYDIGANWGCLSFQAAALPGFHGQIHAFEPVPGTFQDMAALVAQAGLENMIECHCIALSSESGEGRMVLPDGVQSGWAKITSAAGKNSFHVTLRKLDEMSLPAPDLIKIDAEGHEHEVLKGSEALLRDRKPGVVFENWLAPDAMTETVPPLRFLEEIGYSLYCPAWRDGLDPSDGISITNMPASGTGGKFLTLIPMQWEHRLFGPHHWSFFAWHRERKDELVQAFEDHSLM